VTTTSDYFGSKSKPVRSEPSKTNPTAKKDPIVEKSPAKAKAAAATPKATPKKQNDSTPTSVRSTRTSGRKTAAKNYAEDEDDNLAVRKKEDDSGDDIFGADFKRTGKKMDDDYESTDDEDEPIIVQEKTKPTGRKRKSEELSDDEPPPKAATKDKKETPKKPAAKRSRKSAAEEPEDSNMQDIFNSIPTIRPPTPPQRDADKKFNYMAYKAKAQAAPSAAGTKELPKGEENCLAGLIFVFTGVLESISRDEGQDLVKRYGGKVTGAPSSKTNYVVLGNDAGPKKLETIQKLGIKTVNEDGLFALISRLPAHGGCGINAQKAEEKRMKDEARIEQAAKEMEKEEKKASKTQVPPGTTARSAASNGKTTSTVDTRLWTTKYAPTSTTHIIGNKPAVEKLQNWLRNWKKNAKANFKKGGPEGSGLYRAAMLHGGPGIGKTTAAHLVAQLEGYDVVESNASDTRSKKLIETGVKGVLDTTSLLGYFAGDGQTADAKKRNLVLIFDEVDGMSAGDRGGVGAMAAVCRKTSVPIILICNERRLPKMKPFDHNVYELPFRKPTTDQVRTRIQTILFREGMREMMPTPAVNALIESSGADIRRIINMLSTAKMDAQAMSYEDSKKMASAWEKHVILKPWDLCNKILSPSMFAASSKATLNDKIELYFNDHEFSSLMLQENYLNTNMSISQQYDGKERSLKQLELADKAAQSISDGDLCDAMIHGPQQQWSLMPTHAVLSFVRPASFVNGNTSGNVRFTSWLGNNSKASKLGLLLPRGRSNDCRQTRTLCQGDPSAHAPSDIGGSARNPSTILASVVVAARQTAPAVRQ
jgi:replication factor C subunit 1